MAYVLVFFCPLEVLPKVNRGTPKPFSTRTSHFFSTTSGFMIQQPNNKDHIETNYDIIKEPQYADVVLHLFHNKPVYNPPQFQEKISRQDGVFIPVSIGFFKSKNALFTPGIGKCTSSHWITSTRRFVIGGSHVLLSKIHTTTVRGGTCYHCEMIRHCPH